MNQRANVPEVQSNLTERNESRHVSIETGRAMEKAVDRVMKAFVQTHAKMTPEQERKVRDEVSDFIAELLAKRAAQFARFGGSQQKNRRPSSR